MSLRSRVKKFIHDSFSAAIKKGGVLVTQEHAEERIKVCETRKGGKPCEYLGTVYVPFPMKGCQKCGCPTSTKPYFERWKLGGPPIQCPHPEGNMWAEIDNRH